MKKIIITILVGLFSCQTNVVNNDKVKDVKIENNPFSGKDCKPYNLGNPPVEKIILESVEKEIQKYMEKSSIKKENPYLGKIEMIINEGVLPNRGSDEIIINQGNKLKIEELEKFLPGKTVGVKINGKDVFYFHSSELEIIFNNICEYEYFKSNSNIIKTDNLKDVLNDFEFFIFNMDLSKEKIEVEKIEFLLHEYNKKFINNIAKIEFSSTDAIKTFLLFIKLTTQEPIFYRDLKMVIFTNWLVPTVN